MRSIVMIVYLVIGVAVAAARGYLGDVGSIGDIVNLLLAVLLWPLVLLGVEFNLNLGGGGGGKGGNKKGALLLLGPSLACARSALGARRAGRDDVAGGDFH
jgi:hypothetical protein